MTQIQLKNMSKSYGNVEVIEDINLEIADGEFIVLVGPSGCGKSTLLRMIAGLEPITGGDLLFNDRIINHLEPRERDISMVFQSYALYPHMNVARNMGFSLEIRGVGKKEIAERTQKSAEILGLTNLLERLPKELSGGQRQRVAMGRAIARDPKAFLFDEPLSNLDASLRVEMRLEIAKLHKHLKSTMIYVTHDQVEALTLADRIVVLNSGKIQQVGTPLDLYNKPSNLFVANFIGSPKMNIFTASSHLKGIELDGSNIVEWPQAVGQKDVAHFGIRPEHMTLSDKAKGDLIGQVEVVERLGSDSNLYINVENLPQLQVRYSGNTNLEAGDDCGIKLDLSKAHIFNKHGSRL